MPRKAREKSNSGIYHIMMRGINRQIIFADNEDRDIFLSHLKICLQETGNKLYAWCLMDNHVHLMVQVLENDISVMMRKLGAKYVYWYNRKYNRIGNLFQDRFKSEKVEDDKYFLTVLRYIHSNPTKAGLSKELSNYTYSSYIEYLGIDQRQLTDVTFALGMMSLEELKQFHEESNDDTCLDIQLVKRVSDGEAWKIILGLMEARLTMQLKDLERKQRNEVIRQLKEEGLTIRQIEQLTGINRGVIQKA